MITALQCGSRHLDLARPQVMGILNVTPDSFSDGGLFVSVENSLAHARKMVAEGASIIDVGGESTRPGAKAVTVQEELDRVLPVIEAIRAQSDVIISVDTSKPEIMKAAVAAGAGIINDVCALQADGALEAAKQAEVPVCLMHMQGEPRSMQANPQYESVIDDLLAFFKARIETCLTSGIKKGNIIIDPGFGFGKTVEQNYSMLKSLKEFTGLGQPLMAGLSRKSMIGAVIDRPPEERVDASVALATIACLSGANILRVHDVRATMDALAMCVSVMHAK